MTAPLVVLYEDNHCLAVCKPSGAVSAHFGGHEPTVDHAVKEYLKEKHKKPGQVFLGVVHRLDRPVSGVLLFARTSKAAGRLAKQFREGTIEKTYWAVIEGEIDPPAGTMRDCLAKDDDRRLMGIVEPSRAGSKEAMLSYRQRNVRDGRSWVEISPRTGRKHQLRVQFSHRGHPIYGDRKYGSLHRFGNAIALHARSLAFEHPVRHEKVVITAELPSIWEAYFPGLVDKVLR